MPTPISHKFIKDLAAYEPIDQVFCVATKQLRKKKDGSDYIRLELRDKTGKISTNIWDNIFQLDSILENSFVRIKGQVNLYKTELQINTSSISLAADKEINPDYFSHYSSKDIETLYEEFKKILSGIKDASLSKLIKEFLTDTDFVEKFKLSPAAVGKHQPYAGGLLEHTVNILKLAIPISESSPYAGWLNSDLLITGIFLHDIGKIREYEIKVVPQMTDEGRLIGHTVFGIVMLEEKVRNIKDFPVTYKTLLKHLIASHHGEYEYGAPVLPMTAEALVLHYLDNLDARLGEYQILVQNSSNNVAWTDWSKSLDRKFYKAPDIG